MTLVIPRGSGLVTLGGRRAPQTLQILDLEGNLVDDYEEVTSLEVPGLAGNGHRETVSAGNVWMMMATQRLLVVNSGINSGK